MCKKREHPRRDAPNFLALTQVGKVVGVESLYLFLRVEVKFEIPQRVHYTLAFLYLEGQSRMSLQRYLQNSLD